MDLNNLKKTGVNSLEVSDSLHAPLIKFNVEVGETTSIPDENNMIIYVAKDSEDEEKSQIIFPMNSPLNRMNEISDEFVIMPVFLGNKVKMGAYVTRKIGRELEEKSITLNKDLSGSTLKLNLVTFQRFSTFTLFASNNYKIVDHVDTLEDGNYETIALRKSDNTLVDILFRYNSTTQTTITNLTEYTLPDDFGAVTEICTIDFVIDNYFKAWELGDIKVLEKEYKEELSYQPVILNEGANFIYTNYENAILSCIYPQSNELLTSFLATTFSYSLNNEDKFLTLDDLYFKKSFTEVDTDTINALFNKLTIKCLNSVDNTFSLDCEGNLTVNSITTNVQDETSPDIDFDQIYPVGSVYISVNSTNPSTLFGGTWEAFASGKTLVGIDTQQSEFNTVQKTGGEKKHTLTIEEMPSHSHRFKAWAWGYTRASTTNYCADQSMQYDNYEDIGAHIANTGGGQAHNNLQPYIVVYMWKRVA